MLRVMLAAGLSWQGIASAAEAGLADDRQYPEHEWLHEWLPVSGAYLDGLRGGFDFGTGLTISFGIRREVYLNENLIASTNLNIGDIHGSASEHVQSINAVHMLQLVQNGSGNHFDTSTLSQSASLVIQNTLNQQDIRSLTIIDAKTNSLELLKNFNMQSGLNDAISQSVGKR